MPRWGVELGPVANIAAAPGVTDIAVLGDGSVWADRGAGMVRVRPRVPLDSPGKVRAFAVGLCSQMGERLDDACPIADASTFQGLRVHAVIAPIVPEGASVSIRLPPSGDPSLASLRKSGLFPAEWGDLLAALVRRRASILVSGGTGTGKTTLVRALLETCPPGDRIVLVEETRELGGLGRPDCVSLATRRANAEGAGAIGLDALVRATVRMRPDRIVLGECRGPEIADLMRAFNTGHRGGFVTLHADCVERVPQRLIALGQLAGLEAAATARLTEGAFDVLVHLVRRNGQRRIAQVGFLALENGRLRGIPVLEWSGQGPFRTLPDFDRFARRWGWEAHASPCSVVPALSGGDEEALSQIAWEQKGIDSDELGFQAQSRLVKAESRERMKEG